MVDVDGVGVGVADKDIHCVIPVDIFPGTRPGLDAALTPAFC